MRSNKGFLLKYRLGKNRRPTDSFYPNKTNEFTGFVNCHHITYHQKEHKSLSSADSLNLLCTFLKSKPLHQFLQRLSLPLIKNISGSIQEWKMPVLGYNLLTYQELIHSKDRVLSIVFIPPNNVILNGSKIVAWMYWENGQRKYFGTFNYQKFKDEWVLIQTYIQDLKTKKRLN